jgi:CYTH domain-containing protein
MVMAPVVAEADAFDLPEWLGTEEVTWTARATIHDVARVGGELGAGAECLACDLLAADQAFPVPVLDEKWRQHAHQAWTHGQVLLVEYDGRLTLAVPGTGFTADLVLEALTRLAKAVGVKPDRFVAALRL